MTTKISDSSPPSPYHRLHTWSLVSPSVQASHSESVGGGPGFGVLAAALGVVGPGSRALEHGAVSPAAVEGVVGSAVPSIAVYPELGKT